MSAVMSAHSSAITDPIAVPKRSQLNRMHRRSTNTPPIESSSVATDPVTVSTEGRRRRRIGSSPALLLRSPSTVTAITEEDETTPDSSVAGNATLCNDPADDDVFPIETVAVDSTKSVTASSQCVSDDQPDADGDPSSMADGGDDAVKCIFLCEFHATAGPTIAAQVPANYITKEVFDTVNRYIIPKLQLERSFLSVSLLGQKILGYPVRIDNKQYARNAFYFNFCFVFAPTTRTVVYEPVVRKLTEYMLSMEQSTQLLSQRKDPVQMARLSNILGRIRSDLNQRQMCMLQEGSTVIPLCVVPYRRDAPVIQPHVSAVLNGKFHLHDYSQWDLTTSRILPYVNGFNHVARISTLSDVALALVIDCIKHLVLLGVAVAVPVFQYNNVYRPTPKLSQLAKCRKLQQRCLEQCSKSPRSRTTVRDVFRMFASMAHGATFGELCVRCNPAALNINEKQMVLFGLVEGLIRRVDRYPVTVSRNMFADDNNNNHTTATISNTASTSFHQRATRPLPRGESWSNRSPRVGGCTAPDMHSPGGHPFGQRSRHESPATTCYHMAFRQRAPAPTAVPETQPRTTSPKPMAPFYNGLKSLDEICCARGISCQQLEQQLERDRHVIVLLK